MKFQIIAFAALSTFAFGNEETTTDTSTETTAEHATPAPTEPNKMTPPKAGHTKAKAGKPEKCAQHKAGSEEFKKCMHDAGPAKAKN